MRINANGQSSLLPIEAFFKKIPAIQPFFSARWYKEGFWWIKFGIDIHHKLSWQVVQEFGHIVNYVSLNERLPTVFYPVSPPPYMNGGPAEFLSWVIENKDADFTPNDLVEWLEGRLPEHVEDENKWITEEE